MFNEQILREIYNYKGVNLLENYILTGLLKSFAKESKEFGIENALGMYEAVFGEEVSPLFGYMAENEEILQEVAKIEGELLFEGFGETKINQYLAEQKGERLSTLFRGVRPTQKGAWVLNKNSKFDTLRRNLEGGGLTRSGSSAQGFDPTRTSAYFKDAKNTVTGFLGGLWNKLKEVGRGLAQKFTPFLAAGFAWAKNIVKKGISWVANNPIAKVAIPALLIAGGVAGAIKMINKIRKKSGKKEMTKEEKEALESVAKKQKDKLEEYREKAKKAA